MSQPQLGVDTTPLAALSLLSLATTQTGPQSRPVPRSAATTSVSHSALPSYSVPTSKTTTPATTISFSTPPISNTVNAAANGAARGGPITIARGSTTGSQPKARRLSSASLTKRRLNDATAATIQATAASDFVRGTSVVSNPGLSAAAPSKSLSTSYPKPSTSVSTKGPVAVSQSMPVDPEEDNSPGNPLAKKKGTIYRCESCSKAAAILSHLAPEGNNGTSLPEDRSLWPSYLSGGMLPAPKKMTPNAKSNLTATRVMRMQHTLASRSSRKEDSSEEELYNVGSSSKVGSLPIRATSSSLPASSGLGNGLYHSRNQSGRQTFIPSASVGKATGGNADEKSLGSVGESAEDDSPTGPTMGSFGATGSSDSGRYYGSLGNQRTFPLTPTSPIGAGGSFGAQQAHYMANNVPPYARGGTTGTTGRRPGHHRRTSSSLSSSYTRSSIRGGIDDDDDDEMADDDIGYLDKSSFYGSVGTYPTSVSPAMTSSGSRSLPQSGGNATRKKHHTSGDDYDFDVLDERDERDAEADEGDDTVDEDSGEDNHGGAGMEIDMEL
ncbi:hypothetical protein FRB99_008593 [Tulasnella sp. 403]|nr:hypothetical protein FRB99_008593 [Tulasnella sp. 403]